MDDITIPDAAVEAFKAAWHAADDEGRAGERVRAGLTAAAPHIAAQALRDAAAEWEALVQREKPPVRGSSWLNARAERIEADHG